ncbi:hypothetical protein PF008_g16195 [Phytophthora fragariae]|uniref:Uncharacterized protein n=1 Tax=Phytophthora fragariae TaxID=53985 RepID=A0A6G0RD96_9STRA|nr:hypothetical protein PF008_g16195 [Phytophthora fragariae]
MEDGAELSVRSAKLQGFPPFPTWNGTVAAPLWDDRGLLSVLGADGELVVLQSSQRKDDEHATNDSCLRVRKVLPSAGEKRRGLPRAGEDAAAIQRRLHGHHQAKVELQSERGGDGEQTLAHVARVHDEVAVCSVKFSGDGCNAAMGTMDGRLFVRRLDTQEDEELSTFGSTVLSKVLIAPRVTSMSFSACSTQLVVATRKGNVYVFIRASETGEWQTLSSCKDLSANPKPKASGAAGVSKSATAAQTLVACWGPVFVVCSRAVTSRLEMYDFASGCLLHSLQLAPVAASSTTLNTWVDQQLVTGICVLQTGDGSSRLLCHDTSTNLVLVEWPFLDAMNER